MCLKSIIIFIVTINASSQSGLRSLFPAQHRQYTYVLKSNVTSGTLAPGESGASWNLNTKLHVQVYDNFTRARLQLEGSTIKGRGTIKKHITEPWELDYDDNGLIKTIYVGDEPTWATNLKRAISVNFQLTRNTGTYSESEPCLDSACVMVYTTKGNTVRKFTSYRVPTAASSKSWSSVPWANDYSGRPVIDSISSAERVYELDHQKGLMNFDLAGSYRYKTHDHILAVTTSVSLYYETDVPAKSVEKMNLTQTTITYEAGDFCDPWNGIGTLAQSTLKQRARQILLNIANGIDADNIVRNPELIHNLDFIDLLSTVSQFKYNTLIDLFEDLVLGTSYDMETSRNIFLEVLPHARSEASAKFIKYLVMEQKEKVEDAALLSLIRKLPFNIATYSQSLLEELEVFTKLGLDFPPEIRYAGILSFATLVHKTMDNVQVKQDYFENIVVKYFRMYSDCPQYLDRMIWLQGLCNIGYSAEDYIRIIYADSGRDRHERLWAALAVSPKLDDSYKLLETTLSILMNETEHVQLRIASLHLFLSSPNIRESDFMFVHNYIKGSSNNQLMRFWYTTVKNLEASKSFTGYKVASFYVPFVADQVTNPDPLYLATNNYIISGQEDSGSPSLQVFSLGDALGAFPPFIGVKLNTGGRRPYKAALYLTVEGVTTGFYKKFLKSLWSTQVIDVEKLLQVLKNMKAWTLKTPEKVHIDVVMKMHERTVFATHMNQSRFDTMNGEDLAYIEDFLRFGSHINQQIVYYPFQSDVRIPSDMGTPIRLQSTILSFTSIRGNLTAPFTQELTWRNDLHIRYQGTSLTLLSTDDPVTQTDITARIQQSLVAHLPMKFNISFLSTDGAFELTWPNPGAQQGGIAMHSRTQISQKFNRLSKPSIVKTVGGSSNGIINTANGIFFDCDRPMTGEEVVNKLLSSKSNHYDFLASMQPSHIILNTILLFTSPSQGSCGLILSPQRVEHARDDVLQAKIQVQYQTAEEGVVKLDSTFHLSYYSLNNPNEIFLKVEAITKMEQNSVGNTNLQVTVHGHQPQSNSSSGKDWTVCLQKNDTDHASTDQDISIYPTPYEGHLSLTYTGNESTCFESGSTSELTLKYKGVPQNHQEMLQRYFEIEIVGRNLSEIDIFESEAVSRTALGDLMKSYGRKSWNVTAVIKEKNGLASLSINNGAEIQFKSDHFAWLLDGWTGMQVMRTLGLYRECHLQETSVKTLSGVTEQLPSTECPEILALADCSDNSPRFAVIKMKDGIKVYMGGFNVLIKEEDSKLTVNDSNAGEHFWISRKEDSVKVTSRRIGLRVFYKRNGTIIMVPHMYLNSVCGLCTNVEEYNVC